jgi:aminoglycoside phosphotransferase (APT) family kinase protein
VLVARWCDWVDDVLAARGEPVFVHGDLHGYNQVWRDGRLRLVADFDGSGAAEPEYDLRYLPAIGAGGVELVRGVLARYPRPLSLDRVMAWHVRTVLGDAMWRTEARVGLPGGGTAASWVDALARRFDALNVGPRTT